MCINTGLFGMEVSLSLGKALFTDCNIACYISLSTISLSSRFDFFVNRNREILSNPTSGSMCQLFSRKLGLGKTLQNTAVLSVQTSGASHRPQEWGPAGSHQGPGGYHRVWGDPSSTDNHVKKKFTHKFKCNWIQFLVWCVFSQLDFWRGVTDVSTPVDVRVPSHTLESTKVYLDTRELEYSVMIEDLQVRDPLKSHNSVRLWCFLLSDSNLNDIADVQVMLDEEQEEMDSAARVAEPRNTDSFDYSRYHTIDEVRTHTHTHKTMIRQCTMLMY